MRHLVYKVASWLFWDLMIPALALALFLNPLMDDVVSLNTEAATLRDGAILVIPEELTGRPKSPPTLDDAKLKNVSIDGTGRRTFHFYAGDQRVEIPVKITKQDLRYDTNISRIWSGSRYERTRQATLYVDEYSHTPLIRRITAELREARRRLGWTDAEYVQAIVSFVQSLEYDSPPGTEMRAPVRVLLEGAGDCDERAVLAASILRHENYDAALLEFEDEQHAALGVRSTEDSFRDTGYAFVEMTRELPIGEWADLTGPNGESLPLASKPFVIPVGGAIPYDAR